MKVDTYDLLCVLQTLAYTSGRCEATADVIDSTAARNTLRAISGTLRNAADDIRVMFGCYNAIIAGDLSEDTHAEDDD